MTFRVKVRKQRFLHTCKNRHIRIHNLIFFLVLKHQRCFLKWNVNECVTLEWESLFAGISREKYKRQLCCLCVNNCSFDEARGIRGSLTQCECENAWRRAERRSVTDLEAFCSQQKPQQHLTHYLKLIVGLFNIDYTKPLNCRCLSCNFCLG